MTTYGPPGAILENSVQDAVDLAWESYPDDDPIVIEEWEGDTLVAYWWIPNEEFSPPAAHISHREELTDED